MNTELLLEIKKRILADPLQLDMGDWINAKDGVSPCGTTGCIAGWACILDRQQTNPVWSFAAAASHVHMGIAGLAFRGARLLDLTFEESDRLFYVVRWPSAFYNKFNEVVATTDSAVELRKGRALVTAERIDHFIATNGAE